ncbi:hypothetical protein Tco_1043747 [Tanacetum coccineum]|uniref:Uncharacterized protein n=1 Tax=Tanacetum coccineum TaxID=301880 RepID=A0ABQ5GPY4_9ASTR
MSSDSASSEVMAAPTILISAEENLGDPIDVRMDIIHPEPVAVVAFPAAAVEELTALRFRVDIAEVENASLRARIKTTEAIEKITRNRERHAHIKIKQQLAAVQESQCQDREDFRKLKELVTELKPLDLPFGNNFILSLRDELFDMEANSRIFEEDLDIVNEVQRHIKNGSDMALPSTLLAKDGYNIQHDTLGLRYYLTILCSLLSHDDNSSKDIDKEMDEAYSVIDEALQSNIHAEVKST